MQLQLELCLKSMGQRDRVKSKTVDVQFKTERGLAPIAPVATLAGGRKKGGRVELEYFP